MSNPLRSDKESGQTRFINYPSVFLLCAPLELRYWTSLTALSNLSLLLLICAHRRGTATPFCLVCSSSRGRSALLPPRVLCLLDQVRTVFTFRFSGRLTGLFHKVARKALKLSPAECTKALRFTARRDVNTARAGVCALLWAAVLPRGHSV